MKIGETIKKLRKEKDVTQEKLADYLGITYQAISKWENGTALPDITLVVPLANFFGVSVDMLFSFNEDENDAKVKEYTDEYNRLLNIGDIPACAELLRNALREYPHNYNFMEGLARELWHMGFNDGGKPDTALITEAIALGERVVADCTDDGIRHDAIETLCYAYRDIGQKEKARELAKKMPDFHRCSNNLLATVLDGDEKITTMQRNIEDYTDGIGRLLDNIVNADPSLSTKEKITCTETAIKIYQTIFYDENYLFYHRRLTDCFTQLAAYTTEENEPLAIRHLLTAEKHMLASEKADEKPANYTAVFLNKCTHEPSRNCKTFMDTEREFFAKKLDGESFKPISNNPEFIELKNRVKKI